MPPHHYHVRVLRIARRSTAAPRLGAGAGCPAGPHRPDADTSTQPSGVTRHARGGVLPVAGVLAALTLTLLAACGEPPAPPLTAPPEEPGNGSAPASALPPSGVMPGLPPTMPPVVPTTYPPAGPVYPTYPAFPTYPAATTPPTTTSPTPAPSPAPRCGSGPTKEQVLTAVKGRPGVPAADLKVIDGPFCSGTWQFTVVQIAQADADSAEPLLVVTKGKPPTIQVIEAGTDVCSVKVRNEAPTGIRVWACGAA